MSEEERIALANYDTGWDESVEVSRHFGRRHDPEPIQPLIRLAFEQGEERERSEFWLSRTEAEAVARAILRQTATRAGA